MKPFRIFESRAVVAALDHTAPMNSLRTPQGFVSPSVATPFALAWTDVRPTKELVALLKQQCPELVRDPYASAPEEPVPSEEEREWG